MDKIRSCKSHRDQLAHRALTLRFSKKINDDEYKEKSKEYMDISDKIVLILEELLEEREKLMLIDVIQDRKNQQNAVR